LVRAGCCLNPILSCVLCSTGSVESIASERTFVEGPSNVVPTTKATLPLLELEATLPQLELANAMGFKPSQLAGLSRMEVSALLEEGRAAFDSIRAANKKPVSGKQKQAMEDHGIPFSSDMDGQAASQLLESCYTVHKTSLPVSPGQQKMLDRFKLKAANMYEASCVIDAYRCAVHERPASVLQKKYVMSFSPTMAAVDVEKLTHESASRMISAYQATAKGRKSFKKVLTVGPPKA
jgi:hypothetical protein